MLEHPLILYLATQLWSLGLTAPRAGRCPTESRGCRGSFQHRYSLVAITSIRWSRYSCDLVSYSAFRCKFSTSFLPQLRPKLLGTTDGFVEPPEDSASCECTTGSVRAAALGCTWMHWPWLLTKGGSSGISWMSHCPHGCLCYILLQSLILPIYVRFMSPLGKMKQTLLWESFYILSHPEILSHWEGRQISLLFSSGENSSGPWAILAQFCSYNYQSIHTCLCVTSLSLLDCNAKCWWRGSGRRNSRHCMSWRERAGDGHQLWQAVLPDLTQSNNLTFPSSSATLPLETGKLIFLLVLSALPTCISCMKVWDRFLSSTYGQLSKTHPQRVLIINKAIQRWLSFEGTASS